MDGGDREGLENIGQKERLRGSGLLTEYNRPALRASVRLGSEFFSDGMAVGEGALETVQRNCRFQAPHVPGHLGVGML